MIFIDDNGETWVNGIFGVITNDFGTCFVVSFPTRPAMWGVYHFRTHLYAEEKVDGGAMGHTAAYLMGYIGDRDRL